MSHIWAENMIIWNVFNYDYNMYCHYSDIIFCQWIKIVHTYPNKCKELFYANLLIDITYTNCAYIYTHFSNSIQSALC